MKQLFTLFLFLFLENLSFSATLPLKKEIFTENITIEKDSIAPKKRIDISKHIMRGLWVSGGILLGWGALESTEPCPQTNSFINLCFNGLVQIALGIVFLLVGCLIFLGREISDVIQHKRTKKKKIK